MVDNQPIYEFLDLGREGDFTDDAEIGPNGMYDPPDPVEDYTEVHFDELPAEGDIHYDEEIASERAGYSEGDEEFVDIGVQYSKNTQLEGVYDNLDAN